MVVEIPEWKGAILGVERTLIGIGSHCLPSPHTWWWLVVTGV